MKLHNRDTFAVEKIQLPSKLGAFVLYEHGAERLNISIEEFEKRVKENAFQTINTREGLKLINRADFERMVK